VTIGYFPISLIGSHPAFNAALCCENKLPIFAVQLRAESCSSGEVDSRGRHEYGFSALIKLKSEILVKHEARSTNDSRCQPLSQSRRSALYEAGF